MYVVSLPVYFEDEFSLSMVFGDSSKPVMIADIYVGCKAWICAIHGLCCAKHGSMLCMMIHGLPAQFMDCSVQKGQSSNLHKAWIS